MFYASQFLKLSKNQQIELWNTGVNNVLQKLYYKTQEEVDKLTWEAVKHVLRVKVEAKQKLTKLGT